MGHIYLPGPVAIPDPDGWTKMKSGAIHQHQAPEILHLSLPRCDLPEFTFFFPVFVPTTGQELSRELPKKKMSYTRITHWNCVRIMIYSTLAATIYSACPDPPFVSNAVANLDKVIYNIGDKVTYSCSPDYKLIPSLNNVATCGPDETWSTISEDICKRDCEFPDLLENGNVEFSDTVVGSKATYKCGERYILLGNSIRYCLDDGKWNGSVPTCERTCPEPPNLQFAISNLTTNKSVLYYPQSTKVSYTCISGFISNNLLPSFTTCQSDFTWSTISEFCTRVSCGPPGTVENGNVKYVDDKFQSKALFSCNEGYKLVGDTYRECTEDGIWSGDVPTCHRSCPDPPAISFAQIIEMPDNKYFPVGMILTYKCLSGYIYNLFVSPTIQCLEGFTWSILTDFCKKVICGEPEQIKNGKVQITGIDFGSKALYSCNAGYIISGNLTRKCTEDGVWEGRPPTCHSP
ncbi:hypothetical protein GDO81_006335 [Engystomops pustulosus]|uniref:Sushi domain-containing protein n=1 Tax=Engystomops pustulosus TaxID=76066 RepID=A0AAV7CVW5_ENGPU|nr:hypothetical protein GDO81_006335 [Engystomops pustulosus]